MDNSININPVYKMSEEDLRAYDRSKGLNGAGVDTLFVV
jgi:hypothetical protein